MTKSTRDGVRALCGADPTITTAQLNAALMELEGKGPTSLTTQEPMDRLLNRKQVAKILGVSSSTVSDYAKRGLISKVTPGKHAKRARGYSEKSVRELIKNGRAA